jgi:hypothetical protein
MSDFHNARANDGPAPQRERELLEEIKRRDAELAEALRFAPSTRNLPASLERELEGQQKKLRGLLDDWERRTARLL